MVRPQWIAALILALAVAGGFAWLGQWQLGSAIRTDTSSVEQSEQVRPIDELTGPGVPVSDTAAGMVVRVAGRFVPGDFEVVEQRKNDGNVGAWVTGHLEVRDPESNGEVIGGLAIAVGWAPTAHDAAHAIERLESTIIADGGGGEALELEGRYMPSDAAELPKPDADPTRITSMVPAQLVNLWSEHGGPSYAGYVVLHPAAGAQSLLSDAGLAAIDSVPPLPEDTINWLNLFYAVEWVVFAGFAVFFWVRLTRDAWEKEHELKLQATAETA